MAEENATKSSSATPFDIAQHLPLRLIKSEIIPPAPNRTNSGTEPAIDWLYDFAGYTWIAYGASSLLVLSHFPNPLSESEKLIGPIFRQVFELSIDGSGTVSAVSWSPAKPSVGDLAAALDNCIGMFSYNPDTMSDSSFCWSQSAFLVQSTKVEVIKWTVSGDGIIAGGIEVVLWRKREKSWERAWKFKPEVPHSLVSASWSIEGPLATAPLGKLQVGCSSSPLNEASKHVLVNYGSGDSRFFQAELHHPSPICMIQWRPSTGRQLSKDVRHPPRVMLLTSCLDGTVRLWSENDDGKVRKVGKDSHDHKTSKLSFRVVAVIEVNQALDGTLGSNIFVTWAVEIDGIASISNHHFSTTDHQYDKTAFCEWLIGFGPSLTVTLWAIHCLDDFSPLRFPRVTLWKRQELTSPEAGHKGLLLSNVFIRRNKMLSPPIMCSLLELLPCNSLALLQLHSQASPDTQERSTNNFHNEDLLSSHALGFLDIDSHTGNILKVVVHPYVLEGGIAASLDENGVLLFWSLSTDSHGIAGLPTFNPSCKLSGKSLFSESHGKYTSLGWAPAIINEDRVLFMGHAGGIDCFIVKVMENEGDKIAFHRVCTIPFASQDFYQGPTTLYSIPLPTTCNKTFISNSFMLLAVWKNNFQALSWKMTIHQCHLHTNRFDCSCDIRNTAENNLWTFESEFSGKRYCAHVYPYSSIFPAPYDKDMISSLAVVCPSNLFPSESQEWSSTDEYCCSYSTYDIVTGCSDGTVKLWRSVPAKLSSSNSLWDLVGMLAAHEGPVLAISPSICGRKIATVSTAGRLTSASTLHVWECVHLGKAGSFILEDTLHLDTEVVALNWLTLGDGHSLLGVCLQHELKIYAQRRCGGQDGLKSEELIEENVWVCIAVTYTHPVIHDFFWGPKATVGVVHLDYFCLFSPFSLLDKNNLPFHSPQNKDTPLSFKSGLHEHLVPAVFVDSDICDAEEPSVKGSGGELKSRASVNMSARDNLLYLLDIESSKQNLNFDTSIDLWSLSKVAEKLGRSLFAFHPEALLLNISTGNWKRAYVALQHVSENIASSEIYGKRYSFGKGNHVVSQVPLPSYLEGFLSSSTDDKSLQRDEAANGIALSSQFQKGTFAFASSWGHNDTDYAFTSSSMSSEHKNFVDVLGKLYDSAVITNTVKMQIHAIIDILQEVGDPRSVYGSLDEPGRRFWVAVRFQLLYFGKRYSRLPLAGESVVSSGLIGWAFHSDCQENLFNSLLSNEPSWQEMRDIGVGFWYSNTAQLRSKMEKLARQQYLKAKDPKACALLYIALNRIQVLAGLFKMSKNDKDKPLVGFLSRDFQDEKNKAAALKNAYVLMGKHQLELATAFFLLGGDTYSAVTVCAKNLGDEQLALVICHLSEGYGGPLEQHLILKFILPSAISRGDYWLASLLEWMLGNYKKAYITMLGAWTNLTNNESAILSCKKSFLDPSIGPYCLTLANKTNMKNAVGEQKAAIFSRLAVLTSAISLSRCGLPLEALECFSSCLDAFGASSQGTELDNGDVRILNEVLELSPNGSSSNWISCNLAKHKELHAKSDFAMQYLSQLLMEHPSWGDVNVVSFGECSRVESASQEYKRSVEKFLGKLTATLVCLQQKFALDPFLLIDKILLFFYGNGLQFIGYHILCACASRFLSPEQACRFDGFLSYPIRHNLLLRASEEVTTISRFIVSCNINCSHLKLSSSKTVGATESLSYWLVASEFYRRCLIQSLWCLRAKVKLFSDSSAEDLLYIPLTVLDLAEFCVYLASAWSQVNLGGFALITKPLLLRFIQGDAPQDVIKDVHKILSEFRNILADDLPFTNIGAFKFDEQMQREQAGDLIYKIPMDDRWPVIGFSLWGQISGFLNHLLNLLIQKLEESHSVQSPREIPNVTTPSVFAPDGKDQLSTAVLPFCKLLCATYSHISFYCTKQFVSYFMQKGDARTLAVLLSADDSHCEPLSPKSKHFSQNVDSINILKNKSELSPPEILWLICANPKIIPDFVKENLMRLESIKKKSSGVWGELYISILRQCESGETAQEEDSLGSPSKAAGSPVACLTPNDHLFLSSGGKETIVPFNSPKEIYKRTGELFEALCINPIDQHQASLATNRKGIIYFNWEDGLPCGDGSKCIWADADWPHNGWAGSESTPVPTCVYPGVGLGSKKGIHLGLGGATVGAGPLGNPGRELKDGGAIGIPGYSGMGASSLGWGVQEDFEQFIDPAPTTGSVNTSSFSAHPSRPLFLVGSSNTHVYLWEFGKDRASATYGVLPAANVPPPYALASISAVRFDHCGHRFVTAALDGTVCTWQLEVGGRSNVGPTESSICFDNHTLDVTYVTPSGSIIAAAGYSSSGINVVIWDTLAPIATSRASIMCHEGGARSLSVFDNNLGSGSISPLIVTGGKAGDVGLHDFRYIATGRTKKHKHTDNEPNVNMSSTVDMQTKTGDQNRNGMLWYIPKAHAGSVTKISIVPNTSFFLTGSKDGDVKLWDAKRARLVFHWPRLHERHTFLQPSSRGFGGVIRAGVTDIQVVSHGFLSCGGDGTVKLIMLKDFSHL